MPPGHVGTFGRSQVTATQVRVPSGEPVVTLGLVHGLGEKASIWNPLVERLPDDVAVWSYGLPWDAAQGTQWALEREPTVWLERALDLAPTVPEVFVAHSFGANTLLDHLCRRGPASQRGIRPEGIVLVSPFFRPSPQGFHWNDLSHYFNDFDDLLRHGLEVMLGPTPRSPDLLEAMVEKIRDRIGAYGWLRFFDLFSATPMLDLAAVHMPALILGGDRDTASYPADCRSLAGALARAEVTILPQCGHFPMIDYPDRMVALLDDFLRGLGRPLRPYEPARSL